MCQILQTAAIYMEKHGPLIWLVEPSSERHNARLDWFKMATVVGSGAAADCGEPVARRSVPLAFRRNALRHFGRA